MNLMSEVLKSDIALANLAIANAADHTGRYFGFRGFRKAMMVVGLYSEDGIVDSEEIELTLMEAKDNEGTDEQALIEDIVVNGLIGSTVVVSDLTAGTGIEVDDTVTVNGVEFTCKAATDVDELEFEDGDGLALCIAEHCPGLVAVNAVEVVTISSAEVGDVTVTLVETAAALSGWTPEGYTTYATVLIEASAEQLSEGFSHIAINVANGAANDVAAVAFVVRGNPYHAPVNHAVAAGLVTP